MPTITSCYECSLDMLTPPTAFPICTIANTPRLPEHCIEWASILEWPRVFKGESDSLSGYSGPERSALTSPEISPADKKLDNDDPEHIQWLYDTARTRAESFKISGVTWQLTQGVVKRIIPAIASTNAIIAGGFRSPGRRCECFRYRGLNLTPDSAAACCNEAFKIATSTNPYLDNYMYVSRASTPEASQRTLTRLALPAHRMYTGNDSIYTYTFQHQKKPECPVCGGEKITVMRDPSSSLQDLIDMLLERQDLCVCARARSLSF